MHFISPKKISTKIISCFVSFLFLIESLFLPLVTLLPQTASALVLPEGYMNSITSDSRWCGISGWAWDADAPNTPLTIHVYRDRASNDSGGVFITALTADIFRQDLANAGKGNGAHGFRYLFNASSGLFDGAQHNLFIYALDAANPGASSRLSLPATGATIHPIRCSNASSSNPPVLSFSASGIQLTATLTNAAPNTSVTLSSLGPDGFPVSDSAGITDGSGKFSKTYSTDGWGIGAYQGWARVNNVQSNILGFTVTASGVTVSSPDLVPVLSVSPSSFYPGAQITISVTNGAPNATVKVFCRDPNGAVCDDPVSYTTNSNGQFSHAYDTTGWTVGNYFAWVTVGGMKSNTVYFAVASAPASVPASIAIYRSPSTSKTSPYKAGDATVSSSVNSPSLFSTDYTGTGYNQIGTNAPRMFTFSTRQLVESGSCNASTGTCSIPGNWSATDFVCPAGVTGVQQMTEWYTIGNTTSNKLTWYFQCSTTTPASSYTPVGSLDGIDASGNAFGWALDPDSSATSISVHFYIDGAAGAGGTFAGSSVANLSRPDLNATYPGNHGYNFSIPSQWRDGKTHKLYVHGIDLSGDGAKNVLLSQTPKSFTLGTIAPIPVVSVSPSSFYPGAQMTTFVTNGAPNAQVLIFCRDPNGAVCDDANSGTTNSSGQFFRSYDTTGWSAGTHTGWITVSGVQSNTVNWTVITSSKSSLSVSLDPSSPPAGLVFAGSKDVPLLALRFNAQGEAISLRSIGFQFFGFANVSSTLEHYTVWDGSMKVGDGFFVLGRNTSTTTLSSSILIPQNGFKTLLIKGDISQGADPGTVFRLGYNQANQFATYGIGETSGSTIYSSTPGSVEGANMTITAASLPDIAHSVIVIEPGVPASGSVRIKIEIQNAGNSPAANVGLRIVNATTGRDMGGFGGLSLAAGQKYSHVMVDGGTLWQEVCARGGSNALSFRLDPDNIIKESNENNNILDQKVSINCGTASAMFEIRPGPANIMLEIGQIRELTTWFTPPGGIAQDVTNQTQWSSSNPSIVELGAPPGAVVNNVALGRALGMAVITAVYQGQTAQAQVQVQVAGEEVKTIVISRTPSTSATNPYKVGDATVSSSVSPTWLFASDYQGTGYNQIGSNPVRTLPFSTRELVNSGACNAATGKCNIPGNWSATDFVCPTGVTGIQQMKEWYAVNGIPSNTLTWYFQCSVTNPPSFRTPIGNLNEIASDGTVWGWAYDPDSFETPISVHFYVDGAAGQGGTFAGSAIANLSYPDPKDSGWSGNHGFNFSVPQQWRDGKTHKLYVHGIDLSGDGSKNVLLDSVPKSFMLGASSSSDNVLPIGATAVYKGNSNVWAAYRMNEDTILFTRWTDLFSANNTIWRSKSQQGIITSKSNLEISYGPVLFYDNGIPADPYGASDGPYNIVLTPTDLYTIGSGGVRTFVGTRIGYGIIPASYTRQWCGLGTICNKTSYQSWDGWPIWGFMLQEENGVNVDSILMDPFGGLETIQMTLTDHEASRYLFGQAVTPCSEWTTTLGLCKNGTLYMQGGNEVLKIKINDKNLQWWYDGDRDVSIDCGDFGKSGVQYPRDPVVPHGVAIKLADRNSPTRAESTWAASVEGACETDSDRTTPTPTTAPMATLTLERDQEQVLPDQPVSFSGTLNSSLVAFPQGSTLFIAIPEKTAIDRIEIDGRTLGTNEFSVGGGSAKIPFLQNMYNGSHSFRVVLRNEISSVPQLDRRIAIWISVVDAHNMLLLKGRTASVMIAHLPTEVIGRGVSLSVSRTITGQILGGSYCCWVSASSPIQAPGFPTIPGAYIGKNANQMHFPIREFSFGEMDITRGPFFAPNAIPLLPENIAFTLFPSDASMQRVGLSLKQFSESLSREFITAQYQYLLGRDPSSEELSRYLPKFTQWQNPLAALAEVYNRRSDVRQAVLVSRDKSIGGNNSGSPRPSWDKLLAWAAMRGWSEEPSLASFKLQAGFDNNWQLFRELWLKYAPLVGLEDIYRENYNDYFKLDAEKNPITAIAYLCDTSNKDHGNYLKNPGYGADFIDFESCWKNDPMVRHAAILWAKDAGWAYNNIIVEVPTGADVSVPSFDRVIKTINPAGPILVPIFGPDKYPEYATETAMRYPPAQLYYDLISSSEYAQSVEQRFRKNLDSITRLFFGRAADESDILWVKDKFISGGAKESLGYNRLYSWITPQWEPNGVFIASNFNYIDEVEFVKNPRYITDDIYGIRHIQGEIDAVSSRMLEMIEKYDRAELYSQPDNFKRIVSGLYRLYMRRTPTDAEIEAVRGKKFGDIEFKLNQSGEYGKDPASDDAIKNLYRNYLGRDPNDADIAQWGDKTISTIANKIGKSAEMKTYAQQHQENAYIFPIKKITLKDCGFFCSIFSKIVGFALNFIPVVGPLLSGIYTLTTTAATGGASVTGAKSAVNLTSIVINSISRGFNEAGFNGETFVSSVSIARAMAGQAGGVFSMTNLFENADPIVLEGFRTMAQKDADENTSFAASQGGFSYTMKGLASAFTAFTGTDASRAVSPEQSRIAQINISDHYGGGPAAGGGAEQKAVSAMQAKFAFVRTLRRGLRGNDVLRLQQILGETDLSFLPEYRTGYYGVKTEAAVKRFQKRSGLPQVGIVGPKTRALLNTR